MHYHVRKKEHTGAYSCIPKIINVPWSHLLCEQVMSPGLVSEAPGAISCYSHNSLLSISHCSYLPLLQRNQELHNYKTENLQKNVQQNYMSFLVK